MPSDPNTGWYSGLPIPDMRESHMVHDLMHVVAIRWHSVEGYMRAHTK